MTEWSVVAWITAVVVASIGSYCWGYLNGMAVGSEHLIEDPPIEGHDVAGPQAFLRGQRVQPRGGR